MIFKGKRFVSAILASVINESSNKTKNNLCRLTTSKSHRINKIEHLIFIALKVRITVQYLVKTFWLEIIMTK